MKRILSRLPLLMGVLAILVLGGVFLGYPPGPSPRQSRARSESASPSGLNETQSTVHHDKGSGSSGAPLRTPEAHDLVSRVARVVRREMPADELVATLMQVHRHMLQSDGRMEIIKDLVSLIDDPEIDEATRCLALVLLGGWKTEVPREEYLRWVERKRELVAPWVIYSAIMNPIVELKDTDSGTSLDENGKWKEGFWLAVLAGLGAELDPALRPSPGTHGLQQSISSSLLFWNCLGTIEDALLRGWARQWVEQGLKETVRAEILCLLLKGSPPLEDVNLARGFAMDPGAPFRLRALGVSAVDSVRAEGWRQDLTTLMSDDDGSIARTAFIYLRTRAPDDIAAWIRSEAYVRYLNRAQDFEEGGSRASFYEAIATLNDSTGSGPQLAIEMLSREKDPQVRLDMVARVGTVLPTPRVERAQVEVLKYLSGDQDLGVAEAATLALANHAVADTYPGSTAERLALLTHAEAALTRTIAGTQDGSKKRARLSAELQDIQAAKLRLEGKK